jgi:hypothetical protein
MVVSELRPPESSPGERHKRVETNADCQRVIAVHDPMSTECAPMRRYRPMIENIRIFPALS